MTNLACFALASVLVLASAGCKTEKAEPTTTAASATATNPYAIDEEDVPTTVDFEDEANKAITPDNVEAEVAKMEQELK